MKKKKKRNEILVCKNVTKQQYVQVFCLRASFEWSHFTSVLCTGSKAIRSTLQSRYNKQHHRNKQYNTVTLTEKESLIVKPVPPLIPSTMPQIEMIQSIERLAL